MSEFVVEEIDNREAIIKFILMRLKTIKNNMDKQSNDIDGLRKMLEMLIEDEFDG